MVIYWKYNRVWDLDINNIINNEENIRQEHLTVKSVVRTANYYIEEKIRFI